MKLPRKDGGMEIAIMDYASGTVSLHTAPQHVTKDSLEDYVILTLEIGKSCEYMFCENITVVDFRSKKTT